MGNITFFLPAAAAQWKTSCVCVLIATLALTIWAARSLQPNTAALIQPPLLSLDLAQFETLIVYAAPANADPSFRISSKDTQGNWQESELQLSNDQPEQSAQLIAEAIAREQLHF